MSPRRCTRALLAAVTAVGVAACGSADDGAAPADASSPTSSAAVESTAASPPPTATSAPAVGPPATSGTTPTAPATTADPNELVSITVEIPTGSLEFGPDDLVVAERTGDLVVYRDLLAGVTDRRELLADYPDPTGPVNEGPGPNVVDDVAGVVDGTLVFADCCEPVSGNVLVATGDPAAIRPISPGYGPTLSPDGARLASASSMAIQRSSTADGAGVARLLDQDRPDGFLNVEDIAWVDDERLALLGRDDAGYALFPVDAETLAMGAAVRFDAGDDDLPLVRFAGRAPDGELAVMVAGAASTDVRYFRTDDLVEEEPMARGYPAGTSGVQRSPDGRGLLLVDDGWLRWIPDDAGGTPEGQAGSELLGGVNAAWFPTAG